MEIRRYISYFVAAGLGFWLWATWLHDHPPAPVAATPAGQTQAQVSSNGTDYAPTAFNPGQQIKQQLDDKQQIAKVATAVAQRSLISVKTDVLDVAIDPTTGDISAANLLKYPVSLQDKTPVPLLSSVSSNLYIAQSGLIDAKTNQPLVVNYKADQQNYTLKPGDQQLVVTLRGQAQNGLNVEKSYVFTQGSYAVQMRVALKNNSAQNWQGSLYTQLTRRKPAAEDSHFARGHYTGGAISSAQIPYEKVPFKNFETAPISSDNAGGWVAMQEHYFLSAWVPNNQTQSNHYYTHAFEPSDGALPIYTIGFTQPAVNVQSKSQAETSATIYIGPEIAKILQTVAPGLDHTIDYGWLWPVSVILFWILSKIEWLVGNWGWAIVITTVLIKLIFHPFTAKTIRHGNVMRDLQPKMQALKERYADDKAALSKATMELYRKEGINPLGGCLPMLIQIPVFIALYYVLIESVSLRQAPFIFWIHDLSVKDPFYVLPILMGVSMFIQQKLTPSTMDPSQQKVMLILPVVFTVVFLNFPAGLALYWFISNLTQITQQWYLLKTHDKYTAKKKAQRDRKKQPAKR